jgi:small-conductance mechanosensitive channel
MRVLLIFAALSCSMMTAQESGAPVIIDGKEVLRVYGSIEPFSPLERAEEIKRRIVGLAEKQRPVEVTIRPIPAENATAVVVGQVIVLAVVDADAQAVGISRDELAQVHAYAVQKAIEEYRIQHTFGSFLKAGARALVAWVLFCGMVWVLYRGIQSVAVRVRHWCSAQASTRGARGVHLMFWERSSAALIGMIKAVAGILLVFQLSYLVSYTFGLFPQTAGISTTLLDYLRYAFGGIAASIIGYLPSGGFVIIVVWLTHHVLRFLNFLARAIERGDLHISGMHAEMAAPTYQLARVIVLLFTLVVVFPYLPGGKSEAFKGVTIFIGLLLSLGSSSAVSNVLAGLVLTYMRPFQVGDRVKIADNIGDVLEKNLLVTRLQTIKNVEIVISNGAILSGQILNYSALARARGLILHTSVTIGYDPPWRTVHKLLIEAALSTEGVLRDPPPFVLQTSLNDFHVTYELNAYTDEPNEMDNIHSHLHEAIQDMFNQAGIEILSPSFYALRDDNSLTIPEANYEPHSLQAKNRGA